jgi:predicted nucleic acid binding AN1-type Zn finger protein
MENDFYAMPSTMDQSSTTTPPTNKPGRCACPGCKKKVTIMSFTCKFCSSNFCPSHQLPENHKCDIQASGFLEEYRKKALIDIKAMASPKINRFQDIGA